MTDLEIELCQSTYRLRMAAQILKTYGAPAIAEYLTEQVEKNAALLAPMVPQ